MTESLPTQSRRPALSPKHQAYNDALERLRPMTAGELRGAVLNLPAEIRHRLAEGPHPRRWTCGVCEAFGRDWYTNIEPSQSDPLWLVFGYHEVPKCDMRRRDDQHYGPAANEVYERCLEVYRAAGWTGEAEEPNA